MPAPGLATYALAPLMREARQQGSNTLPPRRGRTRTKKRTLQIGRTLSPPQLVDALPPGWKYPENCAVRLSLRDVRCETAAFKETPWLLTVPVRVEGQQVGTLSVYYTEEKPAADEGPFLKEERRLIETIAERIGFFVVRRNLYRAHESLESARSLSQERERAEWSVILDFLRRTDPELLRRITRRMVNYTIKINIFRLYNIQKQRIYTTTRIMDNARIKPSR